MNGLNKKTGYDLCLLFHSSSALLKRLRVLLAGCAEYLSADMKHFSSPCHAHFGKCQTGKLIYCSGFPLFVLAAAVLLTFLVSGSVGLPDQLDPAEIMDGNIPQPNITQFSNNQNQIEFAFNETAKEGKAVIIIPKQANVTKASMKITGLHYQFEFDNTRKNVKTDTKYVIIEDFISLIDKNKNEHDAWMRGNKIFYKNQNTRLKQLNSEKNSVLHPKMVLDNSNVAHMVWEDGGIIGDTPENLYIPYYTNSNDYDFKARQVGTLRSTMNTFPIILLDSKNIAHLIWTYTEETGNSYVFYSNSTNFDEARKISVKEGLNIFPKAVADSNDIIHVAWTERNTTTWEDTFYYANSTDWENKIIEKSLLTGHVIDLITDNKNNLHILWSEDLSTHEIYYANSTGWNFEKIDSIYFSSEHALGFAGPYYSSKIIADSNCVIHRVSQEFNIDHYDIDYSNSNNWANKIKINDADANSLISDFAIDSNDILHVVWSDNRFGNGEDKYDIYYANSIDGKNQRASNSTRLYQGNGKVQILDDTVFVSWKISGQERVEGGYTGEILTANTNYVFPENIGLDIGGDGTNEWNYNGKLMHFEIINDASLADQINIYLQNCGTDICEVPLTIKAEKEGRILLSNLEIYYTLPQEADEEPAPAIQLSGDLPVYSSGGIGGGSVTEITNYIDIKLKEGETKTLTAKIANKINVYMNNEKYIFKAEKSTPNLMQITFLGEKIFLTKDEIKRMDLNLDGTADVLIKLKNIGAESIELSFEALEQKVMKNIAKKEEEEKEVITEIKPEQKIKETEQPEIIRTVTGFLTLIFENEFLPAALFLSAIALIVYFYFRQLRGKDLKAKIKRKK